MASFRFPDHLIKHQKFIGGGAWLGGRSNTHTPLLASAELSCALRAYIVLPKD